MEQPGPGKIQLSYWASYKSIVLPDEWRMLHMANGQARFHPRIPGAFSDCFILCAFPRLCLVQMRNKRMVKARTYEVCDTTVTGPSNSVVPPILSTWGYQALPMHPEPRSVTQLFSTVHLRGTRGTLCPASEGAASSVHFSSWLGIRTAKKPQSFWITSSTGWVIFIEDAATFLWVTKIWVWVLLGRVLLQNEAVESKTSIFHE